MQKQISRVNRAHNPPPPCHNSLSRARTHFFHLTGARMGRELRHEAIALGHRARHQQLKRRTGAAGVVRDRLRDVPKRALQRHRAQHRGCAEHRARALGHAVYGAARGARLDLAAQPVGLHEQQRENEGSVRSCDRAARSIYRSGENILTGVFSSSTKLAMIAAFSWASVNESSTTDASTHGSSARGPGEGHERAPDDGARHRRDDERAPHGPSENQEKS